MGQRLHKHLPGSTTCTEGSAVHRTFLLLPPSFGLGDGLEEAKPCPACTETSRCRRGAAAAAATGVNGRATAQACIIVPDMVAAL